jgi:hypothetical protein
LNAAAVLSSLLARHGVCFSRIPQGITGAVVPNAHDQIYFQLHGIDLFLAAPELMVPFSFHAISATFRRGIMADSAAHCPALSTPRRTSNRSTIKQVLRPTASFAEPPCGAYEIMIAIGRCTHSSAKLCSLSRAPRADASVFTLICRKLKLEAC